MPSLRSSVRIDPEYTKGSSLTLLYGIQRGIVRIIGNGVGAAKVPVVDVLAGPEAVLIRLAAEIRLEVEHAPGCVGAVRLVQQLSRAVGAGRTADVVRDDFSAPGQTASPGQHPQYPPQVA